MSPVHTLDQSRKSKTNEEDTSTHVEMGGVFAKSALPGKDSTRSRWEKAHGRMTGNLCPSPYSVNSYVCEGGSLMSPVLLLTK